MTWLDKNPFQSLIMVYVSLIIEVSCMCRCDVYRFYVKNIKCQCTEIMIVITIKYNILYKTLLYIYNCSNIFKHLHQPWYNLFAWLRLINQRQSYKRMTNSFCFSSHCSNEIIISNLISFLSQLKLIFRW